MGKNPTDRGKNGTKKSVIVDGQGGPLGVVVAGANVHDTRLLERTIDAMVVERPDPGLYEQELCLDKGFDNPTGHAAVALATTPGTSAESARRSSTSEAAGRTPRGAGSSSGPWPG